MFYQPTDPSGQAVYMNTQCTRAHQCIREGAFGKEFWKNFKDKNERYQRALSLGIDERIASIIYEGLTDQLVDYYQESKSDTVPKELLLDWYLEEKHPGLKFDEFTFKSVILENGSYRDLEDKDFDIIHTGFRKTFPWCNYNENSCYKKVIAYSQKNKTDRKIAQLKALKPTERSQKEIIKELVNYLDIPSNERLVARMYLSVWFTGLIQRSLIPGSKFDLVLVLNGVQGVGKTTFLENIFKDDTYVMSNSRELDAKDKLINLSTNSIIIWDEIGSFSSKFMIESIKQFLTLCKDTFRPVYGRQTVDRGRRCVFCATSNDPDVLEDLSGSRRFMVLTVGENGPIDNAKIKEIIPELLSATMVEFNEGKLLPYLSQEQSEFQRKNNESYSKEEPLLDLISKWVNCPINEDEIRREGFTTMGLALECLSMPAPTVTKSHVAHIGKILRSIGYKNKNR